jgi:hypothetical protein
MSALPAQYEFTEEQNRVIGDLGSTMGMVGMISMALGAVIGAVGVFQIISGFLVVGLADLAQGLAFFLTGIWLRGAARGFQLVANTRGQDISHLMSAVIKLRQVYGLQRVFLLAALAFSSIAVVVLVIASRP